MAKKTVSNIFNQPKDRTSYSDGNKSAGILDDFAVRKDIEALQGNINATPTLPNNIANKKYVDDTAGAGGTDEKVKVDAAATADYIGATFSDGVIRTTAPLTYSDGGNWIGIGIDCTAIDHDVLTNTHNLTTDIDHDALTNFAANEHLDWTTDRGATNIHAGNYTDTNTQLVEADITTMGFTKDVEVDWTASQAPAVINAANYTDTGDTTAHASFSQLDYASAGHTGFAPALGANDNYVTDADITLLGNTSGENTGDQAITPEGTAVKSTGEEGATKYLREDGDGTCSWQTPGGASDVKVAVDAGATAGYLGAAWNDGVLHVGTGLSYTDGGNYVTVGLGINGLTELAVAPAASSDFVLLYDTSTGSHKKIKPINLCSLLIDRGDPAAHDYDLTGFTVNGAWHDLDCSSEVPAGMTWILLYVSWNTDGANQRIQFRKNGNTNAITLSAVRTQVADIR